jgi:hypothetical protein
MVEELYFHPIFDLPQRWYYKVKANPSPLAPDYERIYIYICIYIFIYIENYSYKDGSDKVCQN